ncbi:class I SAM-dependent methyltransferase, partial [Planktomarina temperata]|nr:class I SAM-dependent methyltransferase [Planktomarina temperata]
ELEDLWNQNYNDSRYNSYPYDAIVSFIFQEFGKDRIELQQLTALELGFGGGNNLKFLSEVGVNFFGIDAAPSAKKIAAKLLGLTDDARLKIGTFDALPYKDEMFDLVIDRQSIGHNDHSNIDEILLESKRVLKTGGHFFSIVHGLGSTDLKHGERRSGNTFYNFKHGNFSQSGMLTAFDEKNIQHVFGKYFKIKSIKRLIIEDIQEKSLLEQYEIRMEK